MIHTLEYLRVLAAGTAAHAWRALRHGECQCEPCRGHRAYLRETAALYRSVIARDPHVITEDDQGDVYAAIPTLDEARQRRDAA